MKKLSALFLILVSFIYSSPQANAQEPKVWVPYGHELRQIINEVDPVYTTTIRSNESVYDAINRKVRQLCEHHGLNPCREDVLYTPPIFFEEEYQLGSRVYFQFGLHW